MNSNEGFKMSGVLKLLVLMFALNLIFERYLQLQQVYSATPNFDLISTMTMSFKLPHFWTGLLLPISALCALWAAAKLLANIEKDNGVSFENLSGLRQVGEWLVYGASAAILIAPTLEAWILLDQRSFKLHWDLATVAIGMIGVVLKLVARMAEAKSGQQE